MAFPPAASVTIIDKDARLQVVPVDTATWKNKRVILHPTVRYMSFLCRKMSPYRVVEILSPPRLLAFPIFQWMSDRVEKPDVGLAVWESGEAMGRYIARMDSWVPAARRGNRAWGDLGTGLKVISLGCGIGCIPEMVCALRGASVLATDLPHILVRARRNVAMSIPADNTRLRLLALPWGDGLEPMIQAEHGPFDVVIASDVVYDKAIREPLLQTLEGLVTSQTLLLMSFKHRLNQETSFFHELERKLGGRRLEIIPFQDIGCSQNYAVRLVKTVC